MPPGLRQASELYRFVVTGRYSAGTGRDESRPYNTKQTQQNAL